MSAPRLDPARLEVSKLEPDASVPAFTCGDDDLDEFLRDDATRLQTAGVTQVYLAWYELELIGYAAILADSLQLKTNDVKRLRPLTHEDSRVIPAVKLGRLAVSSSFKQRFSGCGLALGHLAADLAESVAETIGCRLLSVDAYRASVDFYRRLGFAVRQADIDDLTRKTVPMWLDLQRERDWR